MDTKSVLATIGDIETRADGSEAEFTGYASVFNVEDSYGDIMQPGSFTRTLGEWKAKNAPIPVLWSHNMRDPDYNIGSVLEATEDEHGLRVRCLLDLESPKGASAYRLLKSGRVREMSFAFSVKESEYGEADDDFVRYVKDVDLYEVSVVPIGANPATDIVAVRSAHGGDTSAPQTSISEELRAAVTAAVLPGVLAAVKSDLAGSGDGSDPDPVDDDDAGGDSPGTDPEPAPAPDPAADVGDSDSGTRSAPVIDDWSAIYYTPPNSA